MSRKLQYNKHGRSFVHLALVGLLMLTTATATAQGSGSSSHVIVGGSVFGGGNKAAVAGNTGVTLNQEGATVTGDVYGGGALANVGTNNTNTTIVDILNGTIEGNVYGGGLGDSQSQGSAHDNIAAIVYGKVYVNIGADNNNGTYTGNATINGSVFGCNNINGTPKDDVFVHVYRTAHDANNKYPENDAGVLQVSLQGLGTPASDNAFAIEAVYGGGNMANYLPNAVDEGDPHSTTVHIHGCKENTIKTVYAGGNAADVGSSTLDLDANTNLIVDGGRFDRIFGGGNGYSASENRDKPWKPEGDGECTNVLSDMRCPDYNPGANIYGTATTTVNGGLYRQVFGSSNQCGDVRTAALTIEKTCDTLMIFEAFGGANQAPIHGDVSTTLACSEYPAVIGNFYGGSNLADIKGNVTLTVLGGAYDFVFGGSKGANTAANIDGDVTLNLHGGTIMRGAFGGSDVNGNITGIITVNVLDTVYDCSLEVDTIYGAGRDAAYTPNNPKAISPRVNIQHATIGHGTGNTEVPGCVFGGGKGRTATVKAHPYVIIGELNTVIYPHTNQILTTLATVTGDVYGGGDAAHVLGGTTVLVQKYNSSAKYVYGGGNAANVDSTKVYINGGTIDTIFGGGHGSITPSVSANVTYHDTISITGGTIGKAFAGSNLKGSIGGRMALNIDKSSASDACDLKVGEVYGGSNQAAGMAGTITIGCTGEWTTTGEPNHTNHNNTDNRIGYELEGVGTVYGGSNQAQIGTNVKPSNIVLNINEGIIDTVFGGNNASGNIYGTIQVNIDSVGACGANHWYLGNVFGGGNRAAYTGTPDVNILHGTVSGNVFGGGNMAGVGGGDVVMTGGTVLTGIYGGCNTSGTVTGNTVVSITGGTVGADGSGANVHGGGYGHQTATNGDVDVTINGATAVIWGDVYGGSALGNVNDASSDQTNVTLTSGTIHGNLYGGGLGDGGHAAAVHGAVQVTVNGGSVYGSVYGCNNVNGAPQSTVKVDINGTDTPGSGYALGNVFGGGNKAAYTYGNGYPQVTVHNCDNSIEYVYGGGNAAAVASTDVKIYGGNTIGYVFGGGNGAGVAANFEMVSGKAVTHIYGGTIDHVFAGNNTSGAITGKSEVHVNKMTEEGHESCQMFIGEVYGGGNFADGKAGTIDIGCTGTLVALGAGEHYGVNQEGIQYVYGGANQADITNGIDLTITSGIIENVFGGNNTSGSVNDTIRVNINKTGSCGWYVGNVFGGGNLAQYSAPSGKPNYPKVNILNGEVSLDVFGGGLGNTGNDGKVTGNPQVTVNGSGASVDGGVYGGGSLAPTAGNPVVTLTNGALTNVYGGGKEASITGAPTVNINGGTVSSGVYGGCDSIGNVSGDITVNVKGGTIGASGARANIHGGGYGENTSTTGNVTVNFGEATDHTTEHSDYPKLYGDVYGGSALGNVNGGPGNKTTVNILNGELLTNPTTSGGFPVYNGGNVFGGGLGRKADPANNIAAAAAKVNGVVEVNIGGHINTRTPDPTNDTLNFGNAIIQGNVYGCNNTNGSPQDSVVVNIYRTHRGEKDEINYTESDATYALHNVFGGGNEADYIPATTAQKKKLKVYIHGCYNSIERTFSGSNAAAAGASNNTVKVNTLIEGGRFDNVFGGGNGEVSDADIYGDVQLEIHGGMVNEFFVGSNQQGSISGESNVIVDQAGGCEEINITEFYCGGKYADFVGDINATITCSEGMHVTNLYGGCKEAHVLAGNDGSGNIHLVVNGGIFDNVYGGSKGTTTKGADIQGNVVLEIFGGTVTNAIFGGSNVKGAIGGTITVNVEQKTGEDYCPLDVSLADVYGGGNQAHYPGVPEPNDSGDPIIGSITHSSQYDYPQVNIKNATVKNVFGGGLKANVIGNPQVHIKHGARILGNVYGGGNMGEVDGSPRVIINGKQVN